MHATEVLVYVEDATWTWDGSQWTEAILTGPVPTPRSFATLAPLGHQVVLFGGGAQNGSATYADTWTFDGQSWTQQEVSGPPARVAGMMATLGNDVVLTGGEGTDGSSLSDTWTWDGHAWSQVTNDGGGAPPRQNATLSAAGHTLVLNGGSACTGGENYYCTEYGDTFIFGGSAWTSASETSGPASRDFAAGASFGGSAWVFGGQTDVVHGGDSNCMDFDDLWAWSGSSWTQSSAGGPAPVAFPVMSPYGGSLILYGGTDCTGTWLTETWAFNGSSWSQLGAAGPKGYWPVLALLTK